ncbi:hypothetical protein DM059_06655, partial [Klebsiella pneumoniae]
MVRVIICHQLNTKNNIISGSEVSRLSVAIHYLLKIESVISQELRRYLVRQMFVFIGEEWECGSGYWVPEDDPVYPSLNTLPY